MKKTPTTIVIIDGLGLSGHTEGNAVTSARTPVLDRLKSEYAYTTLAASGADVGLPDGQPGDSATGTDNIGAGRVVPQVRPQIDAAVADGSVFDNPAFGAAMDACLQHGTALHLVGLLSDGGVHSSIAHLFALLKLASIKGLRRVYLHCFLDGRDVPPRTGLAFLEQTQRKCAEFGVGKIATVMGRWYPMDREGRWERVEQAYDALVYGEAVQNPDPIAAVRESYRNGIPDEMTEPIACDRDGMISDNDSVIFFNFRADRAVELTRAFMDPDFSAFQREHFPLTFVCFADLSAQMPNVLAAFPRPPVKNDLREVLSAAGMTGRRVWKTEEAVEAILSGECDLVSLRLTDCAAAGHSADFAAAIKAVERVDECVGRVVEATIRMGGIAMVTGTYGNVEAMLDDEGRPSPMSTTNRVPFLLCGAGTELREGRLADVAPTLLDVLGLAQPEEMTGRTLILQ